MNPSFSSRTETGHSSTSGPRPARELVECPICTTTVEDPKILPCGHSLCGPRSKENCLLEWEKRQEIHGEIKCPICQKIHRIKASDAPSPFGFRELLENIVKMRVCGKHNSELKYVCYDDKAEICEECWKSTHIDHRIELIEIYKWKQLCSPWERRSFQELREFCLEAAGVFGGGAKYLLEKQDRYTQIADMCLSLQQKQSRLDNQFQQRHLDNNDEDITQLELYIEQIKAELMKLDADLTELDALLAELKRITEQTGAVSAESQNVGNPDTVDTPPEVGTFALDDNSSTSTTELVRKETETEPTISAPTDTIIAFGNDGKNEIWRRETNMWTKWTKGIDCGWGYACVKAQSNIFILGGLRGGEISTETDIYDIPKEEWSKGPQLKVARFGAAAGFDVYNNQIIVLGGGKNSPSSSVEMLKVDRLGRPTTEWEEIKEMMSKRGMCAAALVNYRLFVSGGYTTKRNDSVTASVEMLDLRSATAEWEECAPLHEKRAHHAMISLNNDLFVFGGHNRTNYLASCEKYSQINDIWLKISNMRVPRDRCGVCLMGDRIYVVGGWCDKYENDKTVEMYDPDKNEWTEGPRLTTAIAAIECVSW